MKTSDVKPGSFYQLKDGTKVRVASLNPIQVWEHDGQESYTVTARQLSELPLASEQDCVDVLCALHDDNTGTARELADFTGFKVARVEAALKVLAFRGSVKFLPVANVWTVAR